LSSLNNSIFRLKVEINALKAIIKAGMNMLILDKLEFPAKEDMTLFIKNLQKPIAKLHAYFTKLDS
jgi:hypothetical protein